MALNISPGEIAFVTGAGATSTAHSSITLTNPNSSLVAFKVKTTAPNNYFVKPKAGVLAPGASAEIQVTLQMPSANEQAANTDRFLVQSAVSQSPEGLSRDDWARLDKFAISEQRLPVVFKSASTASIGSAGKTGPTGVPLPKDITLPELVSKHEELVQYAATLQKTNASLEEDLRKRGAAGATRALASKTSGFSLVQIVVALIIAVVVARTSAILGY